MKKLFVTLFVLMGFFANAQYNNSWIDYNKTYYKFKVATDNLFRIPQSVLNAAGLGNVNADHFQMWRNGKQVRLYTSTSNAPLGSADYIEFWGEMNTGEKDNSLYRQPDFQISDRFSLESDSAAYFLTVNPSGGNLRYTYNSSAAPITGTPDAYYMRTVQKFYRDKINPGYGYPASSSSGGTIYLYSSSYDYGEGWSSGDGNEFNYAFANLNIYTGAPANSVSLKVNAAGTINNARNLKITLGTTQVYEASMDGFQLNKAVVNNIALSALGTSNSVNVKTNSTSTFTNDRYVLGKIELTYPSLFNFNNEENTVFELNPSATGNNLEISNFNYGTSQPILLDLTSGVRYLGNTTAVAGKIQFVLPPSGNTRKLVLASQVTSNIKTITGLASKAFTNYSNSTNQGDYLIITHSSLFNDGSGNNPIEQYRQHRSSSAGGGYNAKVMDIEQLYDQFAFGISYHPEAVRNFIMFSNKTFNPTPKYFFLIGKGVFYSSIRWNWYDTLSVTKKLDLVPTFGYPASDNLLACAPGTTKIEVPIGRLSVVSGLEVKKYLDKVKQHENNQSLLSPIVDEKKWMKNVMLLAGGGNPYEVTDFAYKSDNYRKILEDTLYGGKGFLFTKTSSSVIQAANGKTIDSLMTTGMALICYLGHSSQLTFDYSLKDPSFYTNNGKYYFFAASSCLAGNHYNLNSGRFSNYETLAELYTLTDQHGAIGFLSNTHYGLPPVLDKYNNILYENIGKTMYGNTIGNQLKNLSERLIPGTYGSEFFDRIHVEEINLHGDPAIKINSFPKPDYAIEEKDVKFSPSIVTVADNSFDLKFKYHNLGKATGDSIKIFVKRKMPNGSIVTVYDKKVRAANYEDSVSITIPIGISGDKGLSQFSLSLDYDNRVPELFETNNNIGKDIYIIDNDIKPIFPYNYAIVNTVPVKFAASTANTMLPNSQYVMEIDTTILFNSALKKNYSTSGIGGLVEFSPTDINYIPNTVYYWRVAMTTPGSSQSAWNQYSFVYLPTSTPGYNQSHYYQKQNSFYENIQLDNDRKLKFTDVNILFEYSLGNYPPWDHPSSYIRVGSFMLAKFGRNFNTMQFVLLNEAGNPILNNPTPTGGTYGSDPPGTGNQKYQFQFSFYTKEARKKIIDFFDSVPAKHTILMYDFLYTPSVLPLINEWKADTLYYGSGNSLYHKLYNLGLTKIDSFYRNIPFFFIFNKDGNQLPFQRVGDSTTELIVGSAPFKFKNRDGYITSPTFGPAKSWKELHWDGYRMENDGKDFVKIDVIGITDNGSESVLLSVDSATKHKDISFINASTYPYLKLRMFNADSLKTTPYQLDYWRLNYVPVPEGAIAPNLLFSLQDSVMQGDSLKLAFAFKNVSQIAFDSLLKVKIKVTDFNNNTYTYYVPPRKALAPGDTLQVRYAIDSKSLTGINTIFVDVNPDNHQREQFHFNNILYRTAKVEGDLFNPLLDVTFDGVHILNKDIVSSKPNIVIKLKDENRYLALKDTSLINVQLIFPDNSVHTYRFSNDTIRFIPANLSSGDNTATIEFNPTLLMDGEYQLIVSGKDVNGNVAGNLSYKVSFMVYNKPMISDMLNYPNPFTTSTAFVFTLTGSKVPEQLRVQILTITGKVVKEINKEELGPLHIGRNITQYKWDGTDQYGDKLANGVYLYRVITRVNGEKIDKFETGTDKYFNKGYGKMYLMR